MTTNNDNQAVKKTHLKPILKSLILEPDGFTPEHAAEGLRSIMNGEASESQMGGFLTALRLRGVDKNAKMIASLAQEMMNYALKPKIDLSDNQDHESKCTIMADIVGTGGDGWNTFNVSTTAGIIAAGAGLNIVKHGSRASSSNSGSADLLEYMGCRLQSITPTDVEGLIKECHYCFIFAQTFHPAMGYLAKTRRDLGFPTPFNVLGPLTNPVKPQAAIIGVHSQYLGPVMAEALRILGARNYAVVCGEENIDEVSIAGRTNVWHIQQDGSIEPYSIHPSDFGVETHSLEKVAGSTLERNAEILAHILDNKLSPEEEPIRDFVLVNTAFLLYIAKMADSYKSALQMARDSLESGRARKVLSTFAERTQALERENAEKQAL
ncbi:anthranilate phosphoribosyltransferase [Mycoemilia scoparia]|uniref:Anthranilate phosphoribosyltransferase n=1 Tax=Mycoemilia scoparia TaxID=417184 RepID=A0A9W7ZZQ8_9FUNG|nr:anthranilate phosphoribosyltransferase [Mycoemilia scoparia]